MFDAVEDRRCICLISCADGVSYSGNFLKWPPQLSNPSDLNNEEVNQREVYISGKESRC